MNQWEWAKHFYAQTAPLILAAPANEWAVDPYAWKPYITMTPIEAWLWEDIRNANAVFYPQYPVDRFFVDFANPVAKIALECDGKAFHKDIEKDQARESVIRSLGWRVFRFTGRECMEEADAETGEQSTAKTVIDYIANEFGLKRNLPQGSKSGFRKFNELFNKETA